jgi:hypothetical protein
MLSNNQALSGSAVGSADLKLGQRFLPKIRTGTGSETATANSFADNLKNIKSKIATQDVFPGSTGSALPTDVKCELPSQPRTPVNPERPPVPRCGLPEVTLSNLSAQKGFKAVKS